jgi:hypothetical protein
MVLVHGHLAQLFLGGDEEEYRISWQRVHHRTKPFIHGYQEEEREKGRGREQNMPFKDRPPVTCFFQLILSPKVSTIH